jgi:hypothetical protein
LWCSEGRRLYRPELEESQSTLRGSWERGYVRPGAQCYGWPPLHRVRHFSSVFWEWKATNLRRGFSAIMRDPALVGKTAGAHLGKVFHQRPVALVLPVVESWEEQSARVDTLRVA